MLVALPLGMRNVKDLKGSRDATGSTSNKGEGGGRKKQRKKVNQRTPGTTGNPEPSVPRSLTAAKVCRRSPPRGHPASGVWTGAAPVSFSVSAVSVARSKCPTHSSNTLGFWNGERTSPHDRQTCRAAAFVRETNVSTERTNNRKQETKRTKGTKKRSQGPKGRRRQYNVQLCTVPARRTRHW